MALKVKAVERNIKFTKDENDPGVWRYVMSPDLYIALNQAKVIREAALRSGVSQGVMKACWDAAGEVIKAWATEGHSVALPGLGSMRFGLRAKSVAKVEDVCSSRAHGLPDGHHDHELHGLRPLLNKKAPQTGSLFYERVGGEENIPYYILYREYLEVSNKSVNFAP